MPAWGASVLDFGAAQDVLRAAEDADFPEVLLVHLDMDGGGGALPTFVRSRLEGAGGRGLFELEGSVAPTTRRLSGAARGDLPLNQLVATRLLARRGARVEVAGDGEEALRML